MNSYGHLLFYDLFSRKEVGNQSKGIQVDRFSSKVQGHVQKPLVGLDWKRFPKELAPSETKKKKRKIKPNLKEAKKPKSLNPDDLLDRLEKAEKAGDKEENKSDDEDENENEEENQEIEVGEDEDEEMDEGNDYANNYFDNGENYLDDEDDNLDEGGIY